MARLPQTLIVLVLLGATAAAFAVTERLKLEKSPITGTKVTKIFSPVCECHNDVARISFRLRRREKLTVQILDSAGHIVSTLVRGEHERPGRVSYTWDGRDEIGQTVPEGRYRPKVELAEHGRVFILPNPIQVDTTPPTIRITSVSPRVFSPADGPPDRVTARYTVDEPSLAAMLIDGRQRVLSRFRTLSGKLTWFGLIHGRPVPSGTYEIRLRAIDRAGNRSVRTRAVDVRVRYIEIVQPKVTVKVGKRFSVRVSTDARSYKWLFAGRRGTARKHVLVLRAPTVVGTYVLYVVSGSHADRAQIVVTA